MKTLKNVGKEANWQGLQDTKNDTVVSSWIFFLPHISKIGDGKAGNLGLPTGTTKNKPQQRPAISDQRINKREAQEDRTLLENIHCTVTRYHSKSYTPNPASMAAKAEWGVKRSNLVMLYQGASNSLLQWCQGRTVGSQSFHLTRQGLQ